MEAPNAYDIKGKVLTVNEERDLRKRKGGYAPLVLSVTSGKGGVGKTSLSVNLAVDFASKGRKVLVVDGDLSLANVDIMFGLKPAYSFQHLLSGEKGIQDIIVKGPANIHVLPAASGIHELADLGGEQQMLILSQLETLESRYDVVIIDTAAGIGSSVMNFAAATPYILVVVTPEPTSLADSYAVIKVLRQKFNARRFQLVVNNVGNEAGALRVYQTLTTIADSFIDVVIDYLGYIPRDENVSRSISQQKPFVELFPSSASTLAVKKIAEALLAKRSRVRQADAPMLWTRLIEN